MIVADPSDCDFEAGAMIVILPIEKGKIDPN